MNEDFFTEHYRKRAQEDSYCFFSMSELLSIAKLYEGLGARLREVADNLDPSRNKSDRYFWRNFTQPLLDKDFMCSFMVWYFNRLTPDRARVIIDHWKGQINLNDMPPTLEQFRTWQTGKDRRYRTHNLSSGEYKLANDFMQQQVPDFIRAVILIDNGIRAYLAGMMVSIFGDDTAQNLTAASIREAHAKLVQASCIQSMVYEFMPTVILPAAEKQVNISRDTVREGIARSLTTQNAFSSSYTYSSGEISRITCPLKQAIGHVMNMTLETGEDGSLVRGKPAHGGLLFFAMEYFGHGQRRELVRDAGGPVAVAATIS